MSTTLEAADVETAVAVLNIGMEAGQIAAGAIPEDDKAKVAEANDLIVMAEQYEQVVQQAGASNVPMWPTIERLLNTARAAAHVGPSAPAPQPPAEPEPSAAPAPPVQAAPEPQLAPQTTPAPKPPAPVAAEPTPTPNPPLPTGPPDQPAEKEIWLDQSDELWEVINYSGGPQMEARHLASGGKTVIPAGFLKQRAPAEMLEGSDDPDTDDLDHDDDPEDVPMESLMGTQLGQAETPQGIDHTSNRTALDGPEPSPEESGRAPQEFTGPIYYFAQPEANAVWYTHPDCPEPAGRTPWMAPLDDVLHPVDERRECPGCVQYIPVTRDPNSPNITGPDAPHLKHVEPPAEHTPSGMGEFVPQSSDVPEPVSAPEPVQEAPQVPETIVEPQQPAKTSQTLPYAVDNDEGDERYGNLLAQVEKDYSPIGMPAPMDLQYEATPMSDDLTQVSDMEARRLHSQFNALAARARYLAGLDRAKARGCKRVKAKFLKDAMREARREMGKDASVTEVQQRAEENKDVAMWIEREDRHDERAKAYETFLAFYSEDVKALSRDWTMREVEQEGS